MIAVGAGIEEVIRTFERNLIPRRIAFDISYPFEFYVHSTIGYAY